MDGYPPPQGEGGFAVADRLAAVAVVVVGGDTELGIQPVEGLLGVPDRVALELGVGVGELVGEAGVVVVVAGVKVATEAACDLVDGHSLNSWPPKAAGVCRCWSSSSWPSRTARSWSGGSRSGCGLQVGSRVGWLPMQVP
jgi:hypothetical protein